jgi:RHS repeat-associated protein
VVRHNGGIRAFTFGPANDIKWQTNTHGATNTVYGINVQDDGNVIKYTPTWGSALPTTTGTATYGSWGCIGYKIFTNQTLASGQCLQSPNNRFLLIMQTAGNLVLYDLSYSPGAVLFASGSTGVPGSHAVMQGDGNLVVYTPSNTVYWSTGTVTGTANYMLQLQDQGNLVIYKDIWETATVQSPNNGSLSAVSCSIQGNTLGMGSSIPMGSCLTSPSGRFALNMQTDGNLVLYDRTSNPAIAIWSTGTQLTPIDPIVAMKTLYFYDALSNLYCVEQHGNATGGTGCPITPPSAPVAPDPNNVWRRRMFGYDSLSRLLWASNPESGVIQYAYDADGNLLQKTSPAPNQTGSATQTISYCYDELHRVTGKAYSAQTCQGTQLPSGTAAVSYTYDSGTNAKGHLTHVADQAGTADYIYDVLGRLASETRVISGISKSISYDYNLDGSVKTLHYPSGAAITYTPDSAGRILQAVDSANGINYATAATYQADGQMTGFISGNGTGFAGITNTFSYNKRLQPINMSASAPSQTVFSIGYDFHFGAGNNGNVYNIYNYRDRTRDQTFTYDSLNRLTSAQNAGTNCASMVLSGKTEYWGNSYAYDAWGNLTTKSITKCSAENMSLAIAANNRISTAGYGYDAPGNMTADSTDGVSLHYDAENRADTATRSGVTTTFVYDADGNRVKKTTSGGATTLYWYLTPGIVGESDLSGTMKSEYVFFNGERVARRDLVTPTGVFYYFSDHLKTASVITDATGVIKADSDYYPWGGELQFVNADANHYKFTGKERDTESGLDNMGARYYSSGLGRFVTPDWSAKPVPIPYADLTNPQSFNQYAYVLNNPSTKLDPDGHRVELDNTTDKDRKATAQRILKNLTPQERKLFKVGVNQQTHKTELQLKPNANVGGQHGTAFNRLVTEVNDQQHTASVKLQSTYTDPQTGQQQSVGHDAGGGVTFSGGNLGQGNSRILLAPEGNTSDPQHPGTLPGQNGGLVPDQSQTVAGHELMGHGFEVMTTGQTQQNTVVQWENQMRQEQGLPPRQP